MKFSNPSAPIRAKRNKCGGRLPAGYTLIELMVVVAIIGVLASIALPKYADLILKSREAAVKGQLGALRSAISIYYSNNEGVFPGSAATLSKALTRGGKYLASIPPLQVPPPGNHPDTNLIAGSVADTGRWFYSGSPIGYAAVSCKKHRSSDGKIWSQW